jgi:hypothetical protein
MSVDDERAQCARRATREEEERPTKKQLRAHLMSAQIVAQGVMAALWGQAFVLRFSDERLQVG